VRRASAVLRPLVLLVAVLLFSGAGTAAAAVPLAQLVDVVTVVVVGDSITAGTAPDDRADDPGDQSWLNGAQGAPLDFRGGWAVPGATTQDMQDGAEGLGADVLVLMGGTNDINGDVEWATSEENLLGIVTEVDVDTVVLSAIPPFDRDPAAGLDYNAHLVQLAEQQGWEFVDPWVAFADDGAWAPETSGDGVHPTAEVAEQAGAVIREALLI
jgi:lysophospholipase L1-like esterase